MFEQVINNPAFLDKPILLFLNKSDLFNEKIEKLDMKCLFEDYDGGCDFQAATKYLEKQFKQKASNPQQAIYTHVTCATNAATTSFVFCTVKDIILRANGGKMQATV